MEPADFKSKLLFLCVSHTLLHVYTNLPLALLPILIREFGFSIFIASVIVSIPRIFSLIFSIPSGLLADHMGHTRIISLTLFMNVLAASIIVLFPSTMTIILSFSLTSLASTFYHPPALSATSTISPSDFTSRGLGFHGASGTLGIALGPITLGFILPLTEWRFTYLVWIIPIFIVAIISFFIKIRGKLHENVHERKEKTLITPLKGVLSLSFLSFLLLVLFLDAAGSSISTYLTTYLTDYRLIDISLASIIFGINSLIGLASVIMGGYAGDKFGWKKSLRFIISTVAIALFCMFVSISTVQLVTLYLIYGFFNIMTMPITSSLVAKITPEKSRGTAYSFQFIPMTLVGIVLPIILGILIELVEIWIIFPISLTFYIIALIVSQALL
ncbi:MAG: MFS transporter [Candidatus Bathyarchaeota archaeon]|jgi:MFS family permease